MLKMEGMVLAILLIVCGCLGAPLSTDGNKDDGHDIMDYYNQLRKQLVEKFPSVDDDGAYETYEKRMLTRHGREIRSLRYSDLTSELDAELARRHLVENDKREVTPHKGVINSEGATSRELRELQETIRNLEDQIDNKKKQKTTSIQTQDQSTQTDDDDVTIARLHQLLRDRNSQQADPEQDKISKIRQEIQTVEEDLEEVINELPPHQESSSTDTKSTQTDLDSLSHDLSKVSKTKEEDNSQSSINDLASIVKNLIEVNQLAYVKVNERIDALSHKEE